MSRIALLLPLVLAAVATAQSATPTNWNNVTGTSSNAFPTDVGFEGHVANARAPMMVGNDPVNATQWQMNGYTIEMREQPLNASQDSAGSSDIFRNLGTTSPYHSADDLFPETANYTKLPDQCSVEQVHILHRHGARNPTGDSSAPFKFAQAVQAAKSNNTLNANGPMAFLNTWNYTLGVETLAPQGAQELFDSGVGHYLKYGRLLENYTEKVVFRTTSQSRMLDSARYFMLGFFGWNAPQVANLEVLTEVENQNDTLASYYSCKNANVDSFYIGDQLAAQWEEVYAQGPIKRLQPYMAGVKLSPSMVYGMMSLCPYETATQGYSQFCSLFTKSEWEAYEYDIDLQFQGDYGFMNPTGRAQGVGWLVEFLSRLNQTGFTGPVTGQNTTLDNNSTYFPTKQPIYADFTHDDVIHSVMTAMNMTQISDFLPTTQPNPNRRYRASRVTPFAARLVFEVLSCNENNSTQQYIRSKINEAVIPLNADQGCAPRPDGLCKLSDFQDYQTKLVPTAKFDLVCFGNNGTDFTVNGPVRNGTI